MNLLKSKAMINLHTECPVCGQGDIRQDYDFDTMDNCNICGAEWIREDGEIIFNPKTDC